MGGFPAGQPAAAVEYAADMESPALEAQPAEPQAGSGDTERDKVQDVIGRAIGAPSRAPAANLQYSAPTVDGEGGVQRSAAPVAAEGGFANASRNAPCPCGSGRKYKRCHGAPQGQA